MNVYRPTNKSKTWSQHLGLCVIFFGMLCVCSCFAHHIFKLQTYVYFLILLPTELVGLLESSDDDGGDDPACLIGHLKTRVLRQLEQLMHPIVR